MSVQANVQSASEQIAHLPADVLLTLARNPSASREHSKAAVKFLIEMKSPHVRHPEIALLVKELQRETEASQEVEAIVESAIEQEIPTGPLRASVTTQTMHSEPIIRNAGKLGDDALAENWDVDPLYPKSVRKTDS